MSIAATILVASTLVAADNTLTLKWTASPVDPPHASTDGYKLRYWYAPGDYITVFDVGNETLAKLLHQPDGPFYAQITAYHHFADIGYDWESKPTAELFAQLGVSPTPTVTPPPLDTPTPKPTATPTPNETPTPSPTATPAPSRTPTPKPSGTPRPTPSPTSRPTATPAPVAIGRIRNSSARGEIATIDNPFIAGFMLDGKATIAVRISGPSLKKAGVPRPLANPALELYDAKGKLIGKNDNWKSSQQAAIIAAGLAPSNDLESVLIVTLPPGSYTVTAKGGIGTALIEVYNLSK